MVTPSAPPTVGASHPRLQDVVAAELLGVSRNPVREAIRVLETEGFVDAPARRGTPVAVLDEKQALEPLSAGLAAQQGGAAAIAPTEELLTTRHQLRYGGQVAAPSPAEPGEQSTIPPRSGSGGNIDGKELVAGSTLHLLVAVPEALLHLDDGHAARGDGEPRGTAIACPTTTEPSIEVVTDRPLAVVHAQTPTGRITSGSDADLDVAMGDASDAMVSWMQQLHDLDKGTALALASTCVDLRVTRVASQTWGVHALLPTGVLR